MVRALYATLGTSRSLWLGWRLVIDNQDTATWKEKRSWKAVSEVYGERVTAVGQFRHVCITTRRTFWHSDAESLGWPDSVTLCQCYNCSGLWACTLTQEFLRDELEEEQEWWFKWDLWLSSLNITKKNNLPFADHIDERFFRMSENNSELWILSRAGAELFFAHLVWNYSLTRQHLVVKTRFELQPNYICYRVVCPYELSHFANWKFISFFLHSTQNWP